MLDQHYYFGFAIDFQDSGQDQENEDDWKDIVHAINSRKHQEDLSSGGPSADPSNECGKLKDTIKNMEDILGDISKDLVWRDISDSAGQRLKDFFLKAEKLIAEGHQLYADLNKDSRVDSRGKAIPLSRGGWQTEVEEIFGPVEKNGIKA